MADTTVWFITGAARGMGIDIAKAALAAGHSVAATARNEAKVTEALGEHENLLPVSLDITDPVAAKAAIAGVSASTAAPLPRCCKAVHVGTRRTPCFRPARYSCRIRPETRKARTAGSHGCLVRAYWR